MRNRKLAAGAVLVISVTALAPGAARADSSTPTTIYVNHGSASCTDTGTGTQAAPFCTLQAGIDAATVPGDTVSVLDDGYRYAPVTISNSGTSSAPITIQSARLNAQVGSTTTAPAFTFSGASYVTVKGFLVTDTTAQLAYIAGSDHITLDSNLGGIDTFFGSQIVSTVTLPGIEIAGSSSDVTLSRNQIDDLGRDAASIQVDPGSAGDVITTNGIRAGLPAILVNGAPGTVVTSNTVIFAGGYLCNTAISLTGASTGSYIENNALEASTMCDGSSSPSGLLSIASAATNGTTVDYNDLDPNPNLNPPPGDPAGPDEYTYSWAGSYYETVAQFTAASGQGHHDLIGDPEVSPPWGFVVESDFSPVVNSANSDAPGELATDINGKSRVDDPLTPDTGAGTHPYYDRGAAQIQPPANPDTTLTTTANGALGVTVKSVAWSSSGWSFDFGDGSAPVSGTFGVASHTYSKPGTYTITVSGTSTATGQPFTGTTTFTTSGSDYTPTGPTRILDTRRGLGAPKAKVPTITTLHVKITGTASIPADATAVVLNVTVTDTVGNGYISVIPSNGYGTVSNINYLAGKTATNAVIVPVGPDGEIGLMNMGRAGGSADLIADVSGYFTRAAGSGYSAVTPSRILDTRHGTGAPAAKLAPNHALSVGIVGADSIPTGATAVALHVTVTDTGGNGWVAAEPDGAGTPTTSNLNYLKGQTVSNTVIVPVASDGKIELYNGGGTGSVDLIADVAGYFSTDSTGVYTSTIPYRAWDSRKSGTPLTANGTTTYALNASESNSIVPPTVPAGATVITNLTLTDLTANGFVTAYPAGTTRPGVSNLNYLAGQTVAGLSLLGTTGANQQISIYNQSTGHGDVILDVFGYFSN